MLDDRAHVEAVAILRRLLEAQASGLADPDAQLAAVVFLREHHPEPGVYLAALAQGPVSGG